MENNAIKGGTIARTIILALALINQLLSAAGLHIIPIEDATVEALVTAACTIVAALVAWWKNNSFTPEAIAADNHLDAMRRG